MDNGLKDFWIYNPSKLFSSLSIIPSKDMNIGDRLNALTRLIILLTLIFYILGFEQWYTIIIIGIIILFIIKMSSQANREKKIENFVPRRGRFDPCGNCGYDANTSYINAKYEITPQLQFNHDNAGKRSYANAKYEVIPLDVPNPYRAIWRNEGGACPSYSMIPDPYTISPLETMNEIPRGQCNYIQRSYIDVLPEAQGQNGLVATRPAVEASWTRDSMEFRNSMMGEYVDFFQRQRSHNCVDIKPGRKTW